MKTGTVDSKKVGGAATTVVGATVGAMASDAIVSKIPENGKKITKLLLVIAGVVGTVAIKGDDFVSNSVRGLAIGTAVKQSLDVSREILQSALPESIASNGIVKPMLGLGCANDQGRMYPTNYASQYKGSALGVPSGGYRANTLESKPSVNSIFA